MGNKEALRLAKKDRIDKFLRHNAEVYQGEERRWRINFITENTREMLELFPEQQKKISSLKDCVTSSIHFYDVLSIQLAMSS